MVGGAGEGAVNFDGGSNSFEKESKFEKKCFEGDKRRAGGKCISLTFDKEFKSEDFFLNGGDVLGLGGRESRSAASMRRSGQKIKSKWVFPIYNHI